MECSPNEDHCHSSRCTRRCSRGRGLRVEGRHGATRGNARPLGRGVRSRSLSAGVARESVDERSPRRLPRAEETRGDGPHRGRRPVVCDSSDRVKAFKAGADDCIPPPYDVEELLLRSDALVRRSANAYDYPQQLGPIVLMPRTREAFIDGTRTPIPYREFELLSLLVRNADPTVSRRELLRRVGAASAPDSNVLEVHVRRVRAKLGRHERSLETVRGVGYRLITPVPASAPVHLATAT